MWGKFQRKGKKIAADVKAQGGDVKAQCGEQLRCVRFSGFIQLDIFLN